MTSAQELGSLEILQPSRIAENLNFVRRFVQHSCGVRSGAISSWDCFVYLMHPELRAIPRNYHPTLVPLSENYAAFHLCVLDFFKGDVGLSAEFPESSYSAFQKEFQAALESIENNFPAIWPTFLELISFVILAQKPGYDGGSISSRIGLIWISPKPNWTPNDWAELLVHEFIHNVLFLEDMARRLFLAGTERLSAPDVASLSAIRRTVRGYDKSYHSAFVAYGLINFHLRLGNNARAKALLDPLTICVENLIIKSALVSDNGFSHLKELAAKTLDLRKKL